MRTRTRRPGGALAAAAFLALFAGQCADAPGDPGDPGPRPAPDASGPEAALEAALDMLFEGGEGPYRYRTPPSGYDEIAFIPGDSTTFSPFHRAVWDAAAARRRTVDWSGSLPPRTLEIGGLAFDEMGDGEEGYEISILAWVGEGPFRFWGFDMRRNDDVNGGRWVDVAWWRHQCGDRWNLRGRADPAPAFAFEECPWPGRGEGR